MDLEERFVPLPEYFEFVIHLPLGEVVSAPDHQELIFCTAVYDSGCAAFVFGVPIRPAFRASPSRGIMRDSALPREPAARARAAIAGVGRILLMLDVHASARIIGRLGLQVLGQRRGYRRIRRHLVQRHAQRP